MPGIKRRRDYFVTTADKYYNDRSDISKSYCQRCLDLGFYHELGPRRYKKEELINGELPRDADNFLQCGNCGEIVAIIHAKQDNTIEPIKEPDSNIYDSKKELIEHFVKPRRTRNNNNAVKRKVDRDKPEELDTDIKMKVEHGAKLISYSDNSPDL